ncbi:MAG: carboxypeptidase regulatory-like domain-containing protein [bacterium]
MFAAFLLGCWLAGNESCAWADDYSLTIDFSGPETSRDILVWVEIYEYLESSRTIGPLAGLTLCNTKSSLNPPNGAPVSVKLPRGKKYLIKVEPLVGRSSIQSPYQIKEANYQSQFYNRHRTAEEAIADESFVDTTGSATYGTKIISLETGYKIEGSIKKAGSGNTYIEGVTVKVYNENGTPVARYGKSTGTGGVSGVNYTIYGLSPGKYFLLADGAPKGYIRKFYKEGTGTDLLADADLIEIKNSDVTGKNFVLNEGYSIQGALLDPDGKPIKHGARVYLLDAASSTPLGWCFYDPNSGSYDELMTRLSYYQSGGTLDFAYFKNTPQYFIGGLDPNYSVGGLPKGSGGECILLGVDQRGEYAPTVYQNHYFVSDADKIVLRNITQGSVYDLRFRRAGTIEGSVKDKAGKPLNGIVIKAIDARDEMKVVQPLAQTDPNGRYKLVGLPPIDYKIQAVDEVGGKYLWQYYQGKTSFAQATAIQLTDQKLNETHVDFELEIGARITGCIRDAASHEPIPRISVQALRVGTSSPLVNYPVATAPSGIGVSGEDGTYEITGLPAGQYVLFAGPVPGVNYIAVFYKDSYDLNNADPNIVITSPGQVLASYDFSLRKGGIIQGRIIGIPTELRSNLKNNIHVDLADAKTGKLMYTTTELIDPNTLEYKITGIPQGEYKISVTDTRMPPEMLKKYYKENAPKGVSSYKEASIVTIDQAANPIQINFTWDEPGETICGKVSAEGSESTPLPYIKIQAYQVEGSSGELLDSGIYALTNSNGMYCLKGLATGTYILKATDEMTHLYPPEFYNPSNNAFTPDKAARITLPLSTSSASYDFKLNGQLGIINGIITRGAGKEIVRGGWVYLYSSENYQAVQNVITDPNGRYSFTGLAEGSYKIRAFDPERVYVPRFYTSNTTTYAFNRADAESITINYTTPSSSLRKDISLDMEGAKIEGKISGENGSPLSDIFIYLYQPAGNNAWSFVAEYYTTATDSSGKYTIKDLPPGNYRVLAWEYNNNYLPKEYDLTLTQAGKTGVDLTLPKADPGMQMEKTTLDISEGLNLFSFPTRVPLWPALYTVNTLLTEWSPPGDPSIINILRYNSEKGEWENQLSSFLITNGEGYVLYSRAGKKINYQGAAAFSGSDRLAINLQRGKNIVGNIASDTANYDSYHMLKDLSGKVYDIRSYDFRTGKWLNSTLFWGRCGGNRFQIYPTKAYIVDMKEPYLSWLP